MTTSAELVVADVHDSPRDGREERDVDELYDMRCRQQGGYDREHRIARETRGFEARLAELSHPIAHPPERRDP